MKRESWAYERDLCIGREQRVVFDFWHIALVSEVIEAFIWDDGETVA